MEEGRQETEEEEEEEDALTPTLLQHLAT